jgi:hypothetical protein
LQFRRGAALREAQQGEEQPGQGEAEHDGAGDRQRKPAGSAQRSAEGEVGHPQDGQLPLAGRPQQPAADQAGDDRARAEPGTEHPQETGRLAEALDEAVLCGNQYGGEAHDDRCRRQQPAQFRCAADVTEPGQQVAPQVSRLRQWPGFPQPDPGERHSRGHKRERVEDAHRPAADEREQPRTEKR